MVAQIFGTFGLMIFLQYLAMFIWGPSYKFLQHGILIGKSLSLGPITVSYAVLGAGLGSLVAFLVIYWMVNHTKLGRAMEATSIDAEAASYMGINTERINAITWGIGGATVGIAGALLSNFYYIYPTIGIIFVMIAFATVTLGGFGSITGAFFAGLIIGLVEMLGGYYIGNQFQLTLIYGVFFLVMVLRPRGLFGRVGW